MLKENRVKRRILKILGYIQDIFWGNKGFLLLFFLMNYITMAWSLINANKIEVMIGYGFTLFLASFLITVLLQLLYKPFVKRLAKSFLIVASFVPFFIEIFAMYKYKALIGAGIVNSLLETNLHEAVEFMNMYIGFKDYMCLLVVFILVIGVKKYHFCSFLHMSRCLKNRLALGLLFVCLAYTVRMLTVYTDFFWNNDLLPIQRAYASTEVAFKNLQAYRTLSAKVTSTIDLTENNSNIKNIVFVLGESTNRNHMHLYGYYLPNTPNFDKLNENGEISVFRDVISPHSTTVAVLSELFTFCDHESDKDWYEYHNLIDVMNAAGYKTYWLSNQESSGIWGNVAQIYAEHSRVHQFTRIRDSREDYGILDEELFPLIDKAITERSADKNFYVVHLMGGHGLYYNRYPYAFTKFTKDDINLDKAENQKEAIAQYDNALYYNDYIVSSIIDKFRDKETLVIYVPDHGEAVYDEGGVAGHIEENPSRHMIEIPVIMWASDKFKVKYPEKWAAIKAAADQPYMTDDMIYTVMDLADIKTAEFDPEKSIVNTRFNPSRPRIFNGLNYDTQIRVDNIPMEK